MRAGLVAAALALAGGAAFAQGGTVNVYNWSDYIGPETIKAFEAETGIRVVYDVSDSNEVLEAKLLAGRSGYDVVVPTSTYLQRQIPAGVYQPLDRALLPNLGNLDPALMADAAAYDPGNAHAVIYLWGTNGLAYNPAKIVERLGPDFAVDSWSVLFDPAIAAKLADCGIAMLDSPAEMVPIALNYLGLPPDSVASEDLDQVTALLAAVRPHVRYFHSSQYVSDLANGEICLAVSFSGDAFIAADRAEAAGRGVEVAYVVPEEGGMQWFDMLAIPADAPNPANAHAFIDFLLRPEVIAAATNHVFYPNANLPAAEFVDPDILADPAIYPDAARRERLFAQPVHDARGDRALTRLWTRVRTGQ
jgi:putrescine transport system substrate-binding protein